MLVAWHRKGMDNKGHQHQWDRRSAMCCKDKMRMDTQARWHHKARAMDKMHLPWTCRCCQPQSPRSKTCCRRPCSCTRRRARCTSTKRQRQCPGQQQQLLVQVKVPQRTGTAATRAALPQQQQRQQNAQQQTRTVTEATMPQQHRQHQHKQPQHKQATKHRLARSMGTAMMATSRPHRCTMTAGRPALRQWQTTTPTSASPSPPAPSAASTSAAAQAQAQKQQQLLRKMQQPRTPCWTPTMR